MRRCTARPVGGRRTPCTRAWIRDALDSKPAGGQTYFSINGSSYATKGISSSMSPYGDSPESAALVQNPLPDSIDGLLKLRPGRGSDLVQVRLRRAAHHKQILFRH